MLVAAPPVGSGCALSGGQADEGAMETGAGV